ncbi:MAG: Male sterility domain protein, partial [Planctomycetota bacterium]
NVGLDRRDEQWLARHCDRVIHCAAVVKFSSCGEASDVWKTNFGGTRQMLQLCRRIGVRDFHYVSTAYVCGRRQGVIRESELAMGQSFRNDYERSKYEAESLLRADGFLDPATIYRPAVIGGDSQTGYTNSYHGIYVYLRLLHSLLTNTAPDRQGRRFAPLRILLDGTERRNVVPLDWVCSVVCRLLDEPAARGLTFHLAPPTPLTTGEFFDAAYRYFNAYGYEFCGKNRKLTGKVTSYEEAFLAYRTPYEQYELTDPVFDRSNLNRLAADLVCPQIDAEVIRRYVRFAELAAWGKRPLDASLPSTAAPQQRAA